MPRLSRARVVDRDWSRVDPPTGIFGRPVAAEPIIEGQADQSNRFDSSFAILVLARPVNLTPSTLTGVV